MRPHMRSCLRVTLLTLAVAAALALPGSLQTARAGAPGGVDIHSAGTDVTNRSFSFDLQYPDKDTYQPHDIPVTAQTLSFLAGGSNSQQLQAAQKLLSEPIGQAFDEDWSTLKDQNGKTLRDGACNLILQKIQGTQAYFAAGDDVCNLSPYVPTIFGIPQPALATKTSVKAWQKPDGTLALSYWLPANQVTVHVRTPVTCSPGHDPCPTDPQVVATFDLEFQLWADLAHDPCLQNMTTVVDAHNAQIDNGNLSADILGTLEPFINLFKDRPIANPEDYEAPIDQTMIFGVFGLSPIGNACQQLRGQGFTQTAADLGSQALTLRLVHPTDGAPAVEAPIPNLSSPTIGTNTMEVKAGDKLVVNGKYFHVSGTNLRVDYFDDGAFTGQLGQAQIEWGPNGGQTKVDVDTTVHTGFQDRPNTFDANNLQPNTDYKFRVRECGPILQAPVADLACTRWSDFLALKTGLQGGQLVTLYLDAALPAIGSAPLASDGSFQATAAIPSAAISGSHTLDAFVSAATPPGGRADASTTISVVTGNQPLPPQIALVDDPKTNHPSQNPIYEGGSFIVHGDSFAAGQVTIYLDSAQSKVSWPASAGQDGTFTVTLTMPAGAYAGDSHHSLVAVETAGGKTVQATVPVIVAPLR